MTNSRLAPRKVVKIYNARAEIENRIKEAKNTLRWDKTSCTRFETNEARLKGGLAFSNGLDPKHVRIISKMNKKEIAP